MEEVEVEEFKLMEGENGMEWNYWQVYSQMAGHQEDGPLID